MRLSGIAGNVVATSGKAEARIYSATSPHDIELAETWDMPALAKNPRTGMHAFNDFFDRIVRRTKTEVERIEQEASEAIVKPYRIPVLVGLPAQYHLLEASPPLKQQFGLKANDPLTMGTLASGFFHNKITQAIPNHQTSVFPLAAVFEYRTEDTDYEPTASMEDQMMSPAVTHLNEQAMSFMRSYIKTQAHETLGEMRKRNGDLETMKYLHVIHWGRRDRPLYRILTNNPGLLEIYTSTIKQELGLEHDLKISFPHQPITDAIDQILKGEMAESIHEAKGTLPIIISDQPTVAHRSSYKYPAIYASIREGNYIVSVTKLNDDGEPEQDSAACWQMPSGDLMRFSEELSKTIVDVTKDFRDEHGDIKNYRIPVYVNWPCGTKLPDGILPKNFLPNVDIPDVLDEILGSDFLLSTCYKSAEEKLMSFGIDPNHALLFNRDPGLAQGSKQRSLSEMLIGAGEITAAKLKRITQGHFNKASQGDKRSLRFLVRVARFLATVNAETSLMKSLDHDRHSQVITFGEKEDKDWLSGMLNFPEVRTAIAQEFIRVLELPYKPEDMIIDLGAEGIANPENIAINQAIKQIDNIHGRVQETSNDSTAHLEAIYDEDERPIRAPSPNLLKNSKRPSSENDIPKFYGASISGFTGRLSYTKLAGRGEHDIQEIEGGFVKQQSNNKTDLDQIARDLAELARQQEVDKKRLGYVEYKIPLAIGWPCDVSQKGFIEEISRGIGPMAQALSALGHEATANSAIVGAYLFIKMIQEHGIPNPLDHFEMQPRGFCSIAEGGHQEARGRTADMMFKQFHPEIREGWAEYNKGNIKVAYKIFREVTKKCADLYVLQLNLQEINPGFAMFGSTFDRKTLRLFQFLRLFDLRRVFENIVEKEIGKPNYRFRLKLKLLDRKGPQYSDPVRAHMAETMEAIGYTNDVFELPHKPSSITSK